MRTLLSIFALFLVYNFFCQTTKPLGAAATIQSQLQTVRHDTCLDKKFSVVVYLIQDSIFTLTSNPTTHASYSLTTMFSLLNNKFSRICVSFEHCKTVVIPNWTFNDWKAHMNGTDVLREWYTHNTISIFIPKFLFGTYPDLPELGYTYHADTVQRLRNSIVVQYGEHLKSTLFHEFGHFFGLPHTYFEINPTQTTVPPTPPGINTKEFADKSNCLTHGDGFCDTEADPFPIAGNLPGASSANCAPVGLKDGKGKFYSAPSNNYMSSYADMCRCTYSQEQYNAMVRYILRKRMYLH